MNISLNKISNFFKVRKLKRKLKQLNFELFKFENMYEKYSFEEDSELTIYLCIDSVKEEIALLEQQIKELE